MKYAEPLKDDVTHYVDGIKDPPCCTCRHAYKRGMFRLCKVGGDGYKHIGEFKLCSKHEEPEREDK